MAVWSVVNKSDLQKENRIDAEFYQPYFLQLYSDIKSISKGTLKDFVNVSKRQFKPEKLKIFNYVDISSVDIHLGIFETTTIPDENAPDRAQYILKKGDVLVSTVRPNRNAVTIVMNGSERLIGSNGFCVIAPKSFPSEYLFIFCKTKYVKDLLYRLTSASMYPAVTEQDILNLPFYLPSENIISDISEMVKDAFKYLQEAKVLYAEAEQLLLSEIGIKQLDLSHRRTYTTNLSDIQEADRFDAEYFQPKYEIITEALKKTSQKRKVTLTTLGKVSQPMKYGTSEPFDYIEKGIPFLRIADVSNLDFDPDTVKRIPEKQAEKCINERVKDGDLLISRSGTLGMVIPIAKHFDDAVFGSYFIRIRPKIDISRPYLKVFYNSIIGKLVVERLQTGAIQTNLTIPAIEKFPLLLPWKELEEKIEDLINKSKQARLEGKNLLNQSVKKIERLIESKSNN